jgi:hypothetical protein
LARRDVARQLADIDGIHLAEAVDREAVNILEAKQKPQLEYQLGPILLPLTQRDIQPRILPECLN